MLSVHRSVVTEAAISTKTYNALYSGDVNFTAGSNPSITVSVISSVPTNNNTGNNSAANPVLIDVYYVRPDHLGTPRAITDPTTNQKRWEWVSTPFGETQANENPQNLTGAALTTGQLRYNLRFPGQFYDAETGKHYNYFRDFDPSIGRYAESDPIGLRGGASTFGYVKQRPTRFRDKRGLNGDPPPMNFDEPWSPIDWFFGAEGYLFVTGAGMSTLTCTDECGKKQTFRYWKICFGPALGVGGSVGAVLGLSGKSCKEENYSGWFGELGYSLGPLSAGVDLGFNDGRTIRGLPIPLPGPPNGVVEVGVGGGMGASLKAVGCYYFPLP